MNETRIRLRSRLGRFNSLSIWATNLLIGELFDLVVSETVATLMGKYITNQDK